MYGAPFGDKIEDPSIFLKFYAPKFCTYVFHCADAIVEWCGGCLDAPPPPHPLAGLVLRRADRALGGGGSAGRVL